MTKEAARASDRVQRPWLNEYIWAFGIISLTTAVGLALRPHLQITDVAMLFLLAVVVVAYRHRRGPALMASLLSIAAFDLGFVPPYYTFAVHNAAYFLTFAVMLVVALIMSHLTAQIREQAEDARERERRTAALYAMTRELAGGGNLHDQVAIAVRHIGQAGGGEALVLLDALGGEKQAPVWPAEGVFESVAVRVAAAWAYQHGEAAGWGTPHCADAEALVVPLRTPTRTLGLVVLRPPATGPLPHDRNLPTVVALVNQAATALEPAILSEQHQQARVEVEAERLRNSLLSSLSHDLRTPLASIEGAASSLLQNSGNLSSELRQELGETIVEESRRMTRLVSNLLDMVRVESGALAIQKAWQPLEETLGVALLRLEGRMGEHPVETQLANDLPLVPIDELLIEQVFINLLENASKYSGVGSSISVAAWAETGAVVVEVADRGPGIPQGSEEAVFHKFYRIRNSADGTGVGGAGLGLTICRGIITAHGGRIWVQPRDGGGASFRFTIPLVGPPLGLMPPVQEA